MFLLVALGVLIWLIMPTPATVVMLIIFAAVLWNGHAMHGGKKGDEEKGHSIRRKHIH